MFFQPFQKKQANAHFKQREKNDKNKKNKDQVLYNGERGHVTNNIPDSINSIRNYNSNLFIL